MLNLFAVLVVQMAILEKFGQFTINLLPDYGWNKVTAAISIPSRGQKQFHFTYVEGPGSGSGGH